MLGGMRTGERGDGENEMGGGTPGKTERLSQEKES